MATKCQYEMSKTYQYRKVMKPLLERRRRARINKCLDDLKDLLGDYLRQNGEPNVKLEKADILEVTVEHFRKLKLQKQHRKQLRQNEQFSRESFRNGYIKAADEVSRCLASLPRVDIAFGTKLMTHLGLRLNQLESPQSSPISIHTPLSINCSATATATVSVASKSAAYSPDSSGYSSDNSDYGPESSTNFSTSQGLLQISNTLWRPWQHK